MNLGKKILELRKEKGITQNELAERLFVSYQAVSQWENCITNPDVSIIPSIADVFGITIDELFSKEIKQPLNFKVKNYEEDKLYIVIALGNRLLDVLDYNDTIKNYKDVNFIIEKDVNCVQSNFSVTIKGDVSGDVSAGDGVACGNVEGDVSAGDGVACGNVEGDVSAGDGVVCGNVGGDVSAGDGVTCGNVEGDVSAGDEVTCGDVGGNVTTGGSVYCRDVAGDVSAGNNVEANEINGNVNAEKNYF